MTRTEFIKKIEKARKAYIKAQILEDSLFTELDVAFDRLDFENINSKAENAANVAEAIMCYLHYGEYDINKIWDEIMESG